MKKMRAFIKIIIFCLTVFMEIGALSQIEVQAAKAKLTYADRDNADKKVTLYVTGVEKLNKNYYTTIYYDFTSSDGNIYDSKDIEVEFKKDGTNRYKYTLELKKKGTYEIYVNYVNDDINKFTNEVHITYDDSKPKFSLNGESSVEKKGHTYKNCYDFFGSPKKEGNTYYYKGTSATIGVLVYCGSVDLSQLVCKVGGQSLTQTNVKSGSGGFADAQFNINGEVDGTVSFEATNKSGVKSSVSTGKTLVIDNAKPVIKIDDAYAKKNKTVYANKSISVPIQITEKHFDSSNTKVFADGKSVSVSWSSSGDKNNANVKLDQGEHVISVTSTDKAGNVSDEATSAKIIIDTTAPSVVVSGVANGKSYGNKAGERVSYTVSVKISDNYLSKNQSVTLVRIDEKTKKVLETIALQETYNNHTYQCTSGDMENDGYYKLVINAKDKAGNKATTKSLDKQGNFQIKNGKVIGYFFINREGSKYEMDESSVGYFASPIKEPGDIVIYEYNINSIKKENQTVTLITTLGDKILTLGNDYSWEDVSKIKANNEYRHVYKYIIKGDNFREGLYSIKITSSAEVLGDGNNSLKVNAESDNIMNEIMNVDTRQPEASLEKIGGTIYVHIRDNNLNAESVKLKVSGKEVHLTSDEDMSTSTNYYYTANVGNNISEAVLTCSDYSGNEAEPVLLQIEEEDAALVFVVVLITVIAIIVIVATVVMIVWVRRKK